MTTNGVKTSRSIVRKRGLIWNGSTPLGQRFYGIDFGPFAVGVLLDGLEASGYEDAQSALRYIEQRYGRLDGVGWDRVLA